MKKKLTAMLLAVVMVLSTTAIPVSAASQRFTDVPSNHWAYSYIQSAAADGVMNGTGDGLFSPSKTLSRAEFIVMMMRAFYPEEVVTKETELKSKGIDTAWYTAHCALAYDKGLLSNTDGCSAIEDSVLKLYRPNSILYELADDLSVSSAVSISRVDMAAIAGSIMLDKGISELSDADYEAISATIPDFEDVPYSCRRNMATVYYYKVITGVDATGTFNPSGTVDRAVATTIYCRMRDCIRNNGGEVTPTTPTPVVTETPKPTQTPAPVETPTVTPPPTSTFVDVPTTHWAYSYVERAAAEGAVSGSGNGMYNPDRNLTRTEFMIMMTRVFYPTLVEGAKAEWTSPNWYNIYCSAADKLDISDVSFYEAFKDAIDTKNSNTLLTVCSEPISRSDMAVIAEAVMRNRGIETLTDAQKSAADYKIPDVDKHTANCDAIFAVVHHGIITGTDGAGTFHGAGTVNRAAVAAIYCRLSDLLDGTEVKLTPKPAPSEVPETPTPSPVPTETPAPTPSVEPTPAPSEKPVDKTKKAPYATTDDSIVGTWSESDVTLSLATHLAPVDYWSKHSSELKAAVNQDAYNALVFTMLNREWLVKTGYVPDGRRQPRNFNAPCYDKIAVAQNSGFADALVAMCIDGYGYSNGDDLYMPVSDDSTKTAYFITSYKTPTERFGGAFAPIFAKFTDDMADKEKIVIMVEALCEKMVYNDGSPELADIPGAMSSSYWNSTAPLLKGICQDYAYMFNQLCQAAGIPCMTESGYNHAWNLVYADGEWYAVDPSALDTAYGESQKKNGFTEEQVFFDTKDYVVSDMTPNTMLIIETLYKDVYGDK